MCTQNRLLHDAWVASLLGTAALLLVSPYENFNARVSGRKRERRSAQCCPLLITDQGVKGCQYISEYL